MPPRRSSRSTRASIDPQPDPLPAKRKREDPQEKENILSKQNKSRSKVKDLQEITESDVDEEEEQSPPVKKSRPSLEADSDEEVAPRSRRVPAKARAVKKEVEPSTRKGKRAVSSKSIAESSGEESERDSDEDVKSKSKRSTTKSRRVVPATDDEDSDQAMNISDFEDDEDAKPIPKKAKGKGRSRGLPLSLPPPEPDAGDVTITADAAPANEEEDEEEEKSLFDPPPMPPLSQSQTQAAVEEPAGPKSRLVIHKMALVNFKSYAGRQEIGPFHKSFSSIVGPNGSGKSNTIDALLFVFGYRASKMRQGKLSELIHNSARYPDLDECSVEVHFRDIIDLPGPDAFEVVPDSQLVVTRTAFKNNSSRYTINRRTSTFTEVQTLLKGRGIDLDHKRFLILQEQGEVESIAQMKPKGTTDHEDGLLEYLEDIIGTSSYVEPISTSLAQIEVFQEERQHKMQRFANRGEGEECFGGKEERGGELSEVEKREEESLLNVAKFKKELADEQDRNRDDMTHVELLRKNFIEREKTYKEVQDAAAAAVKELAHHEKQAVELHEREKHAASKAKKLKKSLGDDKNAKAKALRTIEDSVDKMEREKIKSEGYEASLDEEEKILESIRDSLKDKTQIFHDQIEVKQKELQPWTAKINAKKAEVDIATSERDALAKKAKAVKDAAEEATNLLQTLQLEQQAKVEKQENHRSEKIAQQKAIAAAEKKLNDAQHGVQDYRAKASLARQKVNEAKDLCSRENVSEQSGGWFDSLQEPRPYQWLPYKYDVAISTACGGLHHMVVDGSIKPKLVFNIYETKTLGAPRQGMDKMPTPENVPRLFDLVQPKEPRFAKAFYKALSDTLVADDMEQANRIAFGAKRYRVVTLAGQIIDINGGMSGGGNNPARGAMSSKFAPEAVSPEVLRALEQESTAAERALDQVMNVIQSAETELDRLKKAAPEIETAFQKLGLDIENGKKTHFRGPKAHIGSQSKPNTGDLARMSKLEAEIDQSMSELGDLQDKSSKIETAIQDLEKKILDIGGAKLLTQKSKVDGIKLHINLANDEITKAEVAKAKAEKDVTKLTAAIKVNSTGVDDLEAELQELHAQIEELGEFCRPHQGLVEQAKAAAENSKEDLETLKTALDEKEEEIQAFKQKEMELQPKLDEAAKMAQDNTELVEHWRDELDTLKLEEIEDDDDDEEDDDEGDSAEKQEPDESTANPDEIKAEANEEMPQKQAKVKASASELQNKRDMITDVELLDEKLKKMKPNLEVLAEYKEREKQFFERAKDLDTITMQRDAEKQNYDSLRKRRLDEFMAGFSLISLKLKEMYQMITLGGNAELELVDSMDPFSEGIIFSVMPPKKSWKNISNLSGGEKTLSSLALVFALHVFKPTPLYFMDEIDAALDFRNVSIVANYIKDRTKNAQFIIISLR
ncbi:RecF/RecN/SMC [Mycena rebaudengoi]|nr:RecF/RecN/SMC [Mycena rebaudengoi]